MGRKGKYILVVVLIVISIIGITGYRMWNKPEEKVEDVQGIPVTAAGLVGEFAADETKANAKYINKAIEVTGTVSGIEQNQDGGTMVLLQSDDPMMVVQCAMQDKGVTVETGKNVKIKGFYSASSLLGISLTGCVIVK